MRETALRLLALGYPVTIIFLLQYYCNRFANLTQLKYYEYNNNIKLEDGTPPLVVPM